MPEPKLKPLLQAIISGVGRKTNNPVIEWDEAGKGFTVQVDGQDQGRFIGKNGVVFWAINAVFWYAGYRQLGGHVVFVLREPEIRSSKLIPFKPNKNWDQARLSSLAEQLTFNTIGEENVRGILVTPMDDAEANIQIQLEPKLKSACEDPSLAEAIETIISAAGRADGCKASVKVSW